MGRLARRACPYGPVYEGRALVRAAFRFVLVIASSPSLLNKNEIASKRLLMLPLPIKAFARPVSIDSQTT